MNIGYLLFMGLLCTTLTLWAVVAIRDDGQGVSEDEASAPEQVPDDNGTDSPEPEEQEEAPAPPEEER